MLEALFFLFDILAMIYLMRWAVNDQIEEGEEKK